MLFQTNQGGDTFLAEFFVSKGKGDGTTQVHAISTTKDICNLAQVGVVLVFFRLHKPVSAQMELRTRRTRYNKD